MTAASIIVATYNRADVLGRAIRSALAQTANPEVVVVDDGSTDATSDVLSEFRDDIVVVRQENRERGAARNVGASAASGKVLVFLDSDDELLPTHVAGILTTLQDRPRIGLAYRQAELYDDRKGRVFRVLPVNPVQGDVLLELAMRNEIPFSGTGVRREVFERVGGFDEDRALSGAEDWELWVRCAAVAPVAFVPGVTVRIHLHSQNTSVGDPQRMEACIRAAWRRIVDGPFTRSRLQPWRKRLRASREASVVTTYLASGDVVGAARVILSALSAEPSLLFTGPLIRASLRTAKTAFRSVS